MTDKALVIFARAPVLGQVKTRLAKDIGADQALAVYQELLDLTLQIGRKLQAVDRYLAHPPNDRLVERPLGYRLVKQRGDDLGQRMKNAFGEAFENGYQRLVLIGSDCPAITKTIIEQAFDALIQDPAVFGPARDGGYYLVGQHAPGHDLFSEIPFSTNQVWSLTKNRLKSLDLPWATLETLEDIDDLASYQRYLGRSGHDRLDRN